MGLEFSTEVYFVRYTLDVVTDIDNLDETLETLRRYYRGSNERKETHGEDF